MLEDIYHLPFFEADKILNSEKNQTEILKFTTKTCLVFTNQKKFSYENFLNLDSINFEYQSKLNFTEILKF